MNFGFSHLIVNGCSFTYCQGLKNPLEEGWPKLLADKLGIPVINLSKPGSGNDRIFRTTIDSIYTNPVPNPLYVIAFSHSSRREEYLNTKRDSTIDEYTNIHLNQSATIELERILMLEYNQLEYSKRKLRYWLALVNTFKVNNISYLTTDFIQDKPEDLQILIKNHKPIYDAINNDPNRIENREAIINNIPTLPCGHDDYPAMTVIADYLYKEIEKRWH